LLVFGAEFFFVTDVFGSRMNTVFKLYYQAWLLLGIAAAAGAWWLYDVLAREPERPMQFMRGVWAGVAALLVAGALLYPLGATLSRTDGLAGDDRTLDGLAYLADSPLAIELGIVRWLRNNADRNDVLVEAIGGQYSSAGRVSAWTGVPAVLGWPGHERQWGRPDDVLEERRAAVDAAYTTPSLEEALAI